MGQRQGRKQGDAYTRAKFDAPTEEWLTAQKKSSESAYAYRWKFFLEFTSKTGAEILANRQNDKDFFWEKQVLDFKTWMLEEKKAAPHSAKGATTRARDTRIHDKDHENVTVLV